MYNEFDNVSKNKTANIKPGSQVEIYFPDEKVEYRFLVSPKTFSGFDNHLIVELPDTFKSTFYKGEDFVQCKFVEKTIIHQFGGEIIKIVYGSPSFVIIKVSETLQSSSYRAKQRVQTKILCEYFAVKVVPGEVISSPQGFATIKDASAGGVSFLTSETIPRGTILKLILNRLNIAMIVEVISHQHVNDKIFYGSRIVQFAPGSEQLYNSMLHRASNIEESETFIGTIY